LRHSLRTRGTLCVNPSPTSLVISARASN
jgi:hypothetical protein